MQNFIVMIICRKCDLAVYNTSEPRQERKPSVDVFVQKRYFISQQTAALSKHYVCFSITMRYSFIDARLYTHDITNIMKTIFYAKL